MNKGRLLRSFPGPAIAVAHDIITDLTFRQAIAQLLTHIDANTPIEAWPTVTKARSVTIETREAVDPKVVTEMLTGILRGIGKPADVLRVQKRTRDDAIWKNTAKPWRRSSLWLLIRVALQTTLTDVDGDCGSAMYKQFTVYFLECVLKEAIEHDLPSDLLFVMSAKISRRTLKLLMKDEPSWMAHTYDVVRKTQTVLETRWKAVERNPDPTGSLQGWSSAKLSFEKDTALSLTTFLPYFDKISRREELALSRSASVVHLDSGPTPCLPDQDRSIFPKFEDLNTGDESNDRYHLMNVELWVEQALWTWLSYTTSGLRSCDFLASLIEQYSSAAYKMYKGSPEDVSIMVLTIMDL